MRGGDCGILTFEIGCSVGIGVGWQDRKLPFHSTKLIMDIPGLEANATDRAFGRKPYSTASGTGFPARGVWA